MPIASYMNRQICPVYFLDPPLTLLIDNIIYNKTNPGNPNSDLTISLEVTSKTQAKKIFPFISEILKTISFLPNERLLLNMIIL